jgi:hypothetical protein
MRRILLGLTALAAFAGILVAAFWGGGKPPKKAEPAPAPTSPPKAADEPPKPPPDLLGVERIPAPEDDWRGARVGVEGRKELEGAMVAYVHSSEFSLLSGRARSAALVSRELALLWGTKKTVVSLAPELPWIVAVEEAPDAPVARDIAAALRTFAGAFRARFKALYDSAPPRADEVAPIIILPTRDEYLRRAKPPAFAVGHTNLNSGWAFVPRSSRPLLEGVLLEAVRQEWVALARPRAPRDGIPLDSLAPWFWEGASAFYAFPPESESRHAHDARAALRDGALHPLSLLLATTRGQLAASSDPRAAFASQPQGWAFTAFLERAAGGKRRDAFDRYAELELSGKGGIEAAKQCFGDLEALDGEYREFVKRLP